MKLDDFRSVAAFRDLCSDGLYQLSCWVKAADLPSLPPARPVYLSIRLTSNPTSNCGFMAYQGDTIALADKDGTFLTVSRHVNVLGVPEVQLLIRHTP